MKLSNRLLVIGFYSTYVVSTIFLFIASTTRSSLPAWGGTADVAVATLIAAMGFVIFSRGKGNPNYQSGHRAALNIVPMLLLGLWAFRNALDFNILLPGLAWRIFFILHILPYGFNLWNQE